MNRYLKPPILLLIKPLNIIIKEKIRKSKKIIFVCKGNICRSAFAEFYTKNQLKKVEIESCGTLDLKSRPSPDKAIQAASLFNAKLSNHMSKVFDIERVKRKTLIICFDLENYFSIIKINPKLIIKTILLSIFGDSFREIEDPYRKDYKNFVVNFKTIKELIDVIKNEYLYYN